MSISSACPEEDNESSMDFNGNEWKLWMAIFKDVIYNKTMMESHSEINHMIDNDELAIMSMPFALIMFTNTLNNDSSINCKNIIIFYGFYILNSVFF